MAFAAMFVFLGRKLPYAIIIAKPTLRLKNTWEIAASQISALSSFDHTGVR